MALWTWTAQWFPYLRQLTVSNLKGQNENFDDDYAKEFLFHWRTSLSDLFHLFKSIITNIFILFLQTNQKEIQRLKETLSSCSLSLTNFFFENKTKDFDWTKE
jgi:hypothetical protein